MRVIRFTGRGSQNSKSWKAESGSPLSLPLLFSFSSIDAILNHSGREKRENAMSGHDSKYFSTTKKGEIPELKEELNSQYKVQFLSFHFHFCNFLLALLSHCRSVLLCCQICFLWIDFVEVFIEFRLIIPDDVWIGTRARWRLLASSFELSFALYLFLAMSS